MYLMYVDECGDSGTKPSSSRFFCLSALIVHESSWHDLASSLEGFWKHLHNSYGLRNNTELHASKMLGRGGGDYDNINKHDRYRMLRELLQFEASFSDLRIINIVLDKMKDGEMRDISPFEYAWKVLIQRFENTIKCRNFPKAQKPSGDEPYDRGIIIVDETDEKKLRSLIRSMRTHNSIPSLGNPQHRRTINLECVVEDPLHKQSDTSLFIQACDVNAYFLKQTVEPNSTVKKFKGKNLFYSLAPVLLKEACQKDEHGIVRL